MRRLASTAMIMLTLGGCASIIEGTDQTISVATEPTGAACAMQRAGVTIGEIPRTPGAVNVEKTKDDITIECALEGFQRTSCLNSSDYAGVGAANALLGILTMGVGFAIDSATGSDNKYESAVAMRMTPADAPTVEKTLLCTDDIEDPVYREDIDAARRDQATEAQGR